MNSFIREIFVFLENETSYPKSNQVSYSLVGTTKMRLIMLIDPFDYERMLFMLRENQSGEKKCILLPKGIKCLKLTIENMKAV